MAPPLVIAEVKVTVPPTHIVVLSAAILTVGATLETTVTIEQIVSGEFVTQPRIDEVPITHISVPSVIGIGAPLYTSVSLLNPGNKISFAVQAKVGVLPPLVVEANKLTVSPEQIINGLGLVLNVMLKGTVATLVMV